MRISTAVLLSLSLFSQQKPSKLKPLADEAIAIDRQSLVDVIAISKDGKYLALMDGQTSDVLLYDPKTFKELRVLNGMPATDSNQIGTGGRHGFLAFSPDSKLLVASRRAPQFKVFPVWDVATGKLLGKLPTTGIQNDSIGFSPTGKEILAAGYDGDAQSGLLVKVWSTELNQGQISPEAKRSFKLTQNLEDIVLDPTGTKIYLYASEKGYVLADATSGVTLDTVENKQRDGEFSYSGMNFGLSPDCKFLAIATGKSGTQVQGQLGQGLLRVWDVEKKTIILDMPQPSLARYMAFSPDGKLVAVSCFEVLNVYGVSTGKLLRSIENAGIGSFAFSPDSGWIFNRDRPGLRVWQLKKP